MKGLPICRPGAFCRGLDLAIEVVSKPSIAVKGKAGRDGQPQEYASYFEDRAARPNAGFGREGRF